MRILHVIDTLAVGGKERMCINLATLFYTRNHHVGILVIQEPDELKSELPDGINLYSLKRKKKVDYKKMKYVSKLITRYDVVHVHSWHDRLYLFVVNFFFPYKKKIVLHDHQSSAPKWLEVIFLRFILKHDQYVTVSYNQYSSIKRLLKLKEAQMHIIGNFIFKNNTNDFVSKDPKCVRLITVANISPGKNLEFLIRVIAKLKDRHKLTYTIVGRVNDIVYFQYLKRIIRIYKLERKVIFLHNINNTESLSGGYHLALNASKRESGPLVLIEYLASEVSFLSSLQGSVSDILRNVLPDNFIRGYRVEDWVLRCEKLLDKPTTNFQKIYHKFFNNEEKYANWMKVYHTMLSD